MGLSTKGTAAHVVISLTHQCPLELQPFTGKILAAFVACLADRNPAVRKTIASAIGHLMKTAKDSSVEKLFLKLRTWYMEKEDSKVSVAYTFQAITRYNPDRMKAHAVQAMPLAFLAMHGIENPDIWEEIWNEGTPGTESGIRLYLQEIVALLNVALQSQQWKMKAQAAQAMGSVGSKLKSSLASKQQGELLIQLLEALSGRTWSGKEQILIALKELIVANPSNVETIMADNQHPLTQEILLNTLLKECSKERIDYKIVALDSTSKIIQVLDLNYFKPLCEMLLPFIRKNEDEEKDEQETYSLDLQLAAVQCLGQAWPEDPETQQVFVCTLLTVFNALIQNTTRKLQVAVTTSVGQIMANYNINDQSDALVFEKVASILAFALSMPKNSQLRAKALQVLEQTLDVIETVKSMDLQDEFKEQVSKSLDDVIKDLATDAAIKDKARQVKKRFQMHQKMDCD